MKAIDPRPRPKIDLDEPEPDASDLANVRPVWTMVHALAYVILRRIVHIPTLEALQRVSITHDEPPDRNSQIYPSMDVIYRDRLMRSERMNQADLISLLELYMRAVDEGAQRIKNRIKEEADMGHETAAAMVYVQCCEGNLPIPNRAQALKEDAAVLRTKSVSPEAMKRKAKPDAKPKEKEKARDETIQLKESIVPYKRWGLLEGLGYLTMTEILHMSDKEIATVIPFYPDILQSLQYHVYSETEVEYDFKVLKAPRIGIQRVKLLFHDFLQLNTNNINRIKNCFSGSKRSGYQKAASMIYIEATTCKRPVAPRNPPHRDEREPFRRDRDRRIMQPVERLAHGREPMSNGPAKANPRGRHIKQNYMRIIEVWNLLDIINFVVLRTHLKKGWQVIATALNTRQNDVETMIVNPSHSMTGTIWPPMKLTYELKEITSVKMSLQNVDMLVNRFMSSSSSALDRIQACYDKFGLGCEQAAAMIYCETFPKIRYRLENSWMDNTQRNEATEPQNGSNPLFVNDNDTSSLLDASNHKRPLQAVHNADQEEFVSSKKVKTWSHMNNLQKLSRREPVPNAKHLNLVIPGKLTERKSSGAENSLNASKHRAHDGASTPDVHTLNHAILGQSEGNKRELPLNETLEDKSKVRVDPPASNDSMDEDIALPEIFDRVKIKQEPPDEHIPVTVAQEIGTIRDSVQEPPRMNFTPANASGNASDTSRVESEEFEEDMDTRESLTTSNKNDSIVTEFPKYSNTTDNNPTTFITEESWPKLPPFANTSEILSLNHFRALVRIFSIPDTTRHASLVERYIRMKIPTLTASTATNEYIGVLVRAMETQDECKLIGMGVLQHYLDGVRGTSGDVLEFIMDHDSSQLNLTERYLALLP